MDAWARVRGHLQRARELQARLDAGEARNRAALAQQEGLTRARVTQLLKLLQLAPAVQERIDTDHSSGRALGERALRKLAAMPDPDQQAQAFEESLAALPQPTQRARHAEGARPKGFQHLFERARRYRAMLDADPFLSLRALGASEGITGNRVGQILNLLYLAPEIIERLDVPPEQTPPGITERMIRRVAAKRDLSEQVAAFQALLTDREELRGA